jgi:hypothetical protein
MDLKMPEIHAPSSSRATRIWGRTTMIRCFKACRCCSNPSR